MPSSHACESRMRGMRGTGQWFGVMAAAFALLVIMAVAQAQGIKPEQVGWLWPLAWWFAWFVLTVGLVQVVRETFARNAFPAHLAFVDATVLTVIWTIKRRRRLSHGSNFSLRPLPEFVAVEHMPLDVARAIIKNVSHGSMVDALDLAADLTFWNDRRQQPFPTFRARPSGNQEPWQAGAIEKIPNRINVPYLATDHWDVAIRHRDTPTAYGFNTESYRANARAEAPTIE